MIDLNRMRSLAKKWLNGTINDTEKQEFEAWYTTQPTENIAWSKDASEEELKQRLFNSLQQQIVAEQTPVLTLPVRKNPVRRIAVVASLLLILVTGSYFAFFNKIKKQDGIVQTGLPKDVVAPDKTKAMITLADGRVVSIESLTSVVQGNVQLTKTADGRIVYSGVYSGSTSEVAYNTFNNPIGSPVMDMTLADGSHVWLNAGSSLTYPVSFIGNERKVSITGEAYFEVTHDNTKPFYVTKGTMQVQVLGTHFNVNAYDDEQDIKVTLLEGSVKASLSGGPSSLLKPGEQAQLTNDIKVVKGINTDQVMAWKNGLFRFDRADIGLVMRQISRWYGVEVEYRGQVNQHFGGTISRQVNASKVFEMLEMTGGVKFKIEGKKIIVMP